MSELYNRYIDVEDLEDIELNHLRSSISSERNIQTCIQFIYRMFYRNTKKSCPSNLFSEKH